MLSLINTVANAAGSLLFGVLSFTGPWIGMIIVSALVAVLALFAVKHTSNQAAIRRSRNRMIARVLELLLYQERLSSIFGATGRMFVASGPYLLHNLRPLVVLAPLMILLMIQLAARYEWRPVHPGENLVLTMQLDEAHPVLETEIGIEPTPGIEIETDPVRSVASNQASWRIRPTQPGTHWIEFHAGESTLRKHVAVGDGLARVSPKKVRDGFWDTLLYPIEPVIPKTSPFSSVELGYPKGELLVGTWTIHWLVAFLVLTLGIGLLLSGPLGVEI